MDLLTEYNRLLEEQKHLDEMSIPEILSKGIQKFKNIKSDDFSEFLAKIGKKKIRVEYNDARSDQELIGVFSLNKSKHQLIFKHKRGQDSLDPERSEIIFNIDTLSFKKDKRGHLIMIDGSEGDNIYHLEV